MQALPVELSLQILQTALDVHNAPGDILCVCQAWHDALVPYLHGDVRIKSLRQLYLFSFTSRLRVVVKSFFLHLLSDSFVQFTGTANNSTIAFGPRDPSQKRGDSRDIRTRVIDIGGVWGLLGKALGKCSRVANVGLRMHSYVADPNLARIASSLGLVNPRSFSWTGPDPDHHFSTAIVAPATEHLFRAIRSWKNLEELRLTNIKLPSPSSHFTLTSAFAFQSHPSLRTIHLGQVVSFELEDIAALVLNVSTLQLLTLEDAYSLSIWGPRIRDADIEKLLPHLPDENPRKIRIKRVVRCTVRLERMVGGDRG